MKLYKLSWKLHKWIGIALSLVLLNLTVTGLLLIEKKDYEWIQPSTRTGQEGVPDEFISILAAMDVAFSCQHPDFSSIDDIDRIDVRPSKRVYKLRSKHNHAEIQVDAITGEILNQATRKSDHFEQVHDGSFLGSWAHGFFMPIIGWANIILIVTGLYLWLGKPRRRT